MWAAVKGEGHGCVALGPMGLAQLTPDKLLHAEPTAQLGIQSGAATACAAASRPALSNSGRHGEAPLTVERRAQLNKHCRPHTLTHAVWRRPSTTPSVPGLDNWSGQGPTLPLVQPSNQTHVPGPG
jgi:hypothetical protein